MSVDMTHVSQGPGRPSASSPSQANQPCRAHSAWSLMLGLLHCTQGAGAAQSPAAEAANGAADNAGAADGPTPPPVLEWSHIVDVEPRSAIASEGLSLLAAPSAGVLVSFGGDNGFLPCVKEQVGRHQKRRMPAGRCRLQACCPTHCLTAAARARTIQYGSDSPCMLCYLLRCPGLIFSADSASLTQATMASTMQTCTFSGQV